jgi:hypothetical protein
MARCVVLLCVLAVTACSTDEEPQLIRGSARLPDCIEAPVFDIDGSLWFDNGSVTVTSAGCEEPAGTTLGVCGLGWEASQTGQDVEIIVDHEYRILGRACGSQLYLEGGWWLTVQTANGFCDYEDGIEVGIEEGGSTLDVAATQDQMTGKLLIAERCTAEYDVTFYRSGGRLR